MMWKYSQIESEVEVSSCYHSSWPAHLAKTRANCLLNPTMILEYHALQQALIFFHNTGPQKKTRITHALQQRSLVHTNFLCPRLTSRSCSKKRRSQRIHGPVVAAHANSFTPASHRADLLRLLHPEAPHDRVLARLLPAAFCIHPKLAPARNNNVPASPDHVDTTLDCSDKCPISRKLILARSVFDVRETNLPGA